MTAAALDPGQIEARQTEKLRLLMAAVLATNPFYSAKLRAAGVFANPASVGEFTRRVPFTFKAELVDDQTRNPPYGSNLTEPLDRYSRYHQTSGTSGRPCATPTSSPSS